MSWINVTVTTTVKVTKYKTGPFEHAVSMSKRPAGSIYIGKIIYYLTNLRTPFPRGLEADLKGGSMFPTPTLSIHINKLGLF